MFTFTTLESPAPNTPGFDERYRISNEDEELEYSLEDGFKLLCWIDVKALMKHFDAMLDPFNDAYEYYICLLIQLEFWKLCDKCHIEVIDIEHALLEDHEIISDNQIRGIFSMMDLKHAEKLTGESFIEYPPERIKQFSVKLRMALLQRLLDKNIEFFPVTCVLEY